MNKPISIPQLNDLNQAVDTFVRTVIASGLSALDKRTTPSEYVRRQWHDRNIDLVIRAAVSPATIAGNPALAAVAIAFLESASSRADQCHRQVARVPDNEPNNSGFILVVGRPRTRLMLGGV